MDARTQLSAIDREIAIQILPCIDRYLSSRAGDVKKLKPPETGFRLRCGDYRLFFDLTGKTNLHHSACDTDRGLPLTAGTNSGALLRDRMCTRNLTLLRFPHHLP